MKTTILSVLLVFLGASVLLPAQNSSKAELTALEAGFNQVLLRGDWKALEQIEADDLIFTEADGSVTNKSDQVDSLRSGDLKFESIDMSDVAVRDFGNVALVTGKLVEKVRYRTTDLSGAYRFTDVWVNRDGKWRLVSGQETLIPSSK